MADLTIVEAIVKLRSLPGKAGAVGVKCLKEEFSRGGHNDTGKTLDSFHSETISNEAVFVGSSAKGAYYVQKGRKASVPKTAKALHWNATPKWSAATVMYSRPVKGDDYIGRAAKRIPQELDKY